RDLLRRAHQAGSPLFRWRRNSLRSAHAHDIASLDRESLSYHANEWLSLGCSDHLERNVRLTRARLVNRLAWFQQTATLRILDDGNRQAILHGGQWIEELALHIHGRMRWSEAIDTYDRSATDRAEDVVVDHRLANGIR